MLNGWRVLAASVVVVVLTGCGAATGPTEPEEPATPTPSSSPSSSPSTSPSPSSSPVSGLTLRQLGFRNGPLDAFALPADLAVSTRVDQPNVVTVVLSAPAPAAVEDFLRATLPAAGFTIDTERAAGPALTFAGNGWTGGFTGTGGTSAIVLRPA